MSQEFAARLAGVGVRFGKVQALENVTLDIPAGCMAGLIGPDGVGKSTLLSLVAGARKIQAGTVRVLGADIARARDRARLMPRIAYMPQGLGKNLYATLSVAENLEFFGRLFGHDAAERARRIAELTAATGLAPFLDRPAGKLSGGMKQRLAVALALLGASSSAVRPSPGSSPPEQPPGSAPARRSCTSPFAGSRPPSGGSSLPRPRRPRCSAGSRTGHPR